MAMFWSRKSKAQKDYEAEKSMAKIAPKKGVINEKDQDLRTDSKKEKAIITVKTHLPMVSGNIDLNTIETIIRPHITEKSGILSQIGQYTFEVSQRVNKQMVAKAIKSLYKVNPVRVTIINLPRKNVFVKGRKGVVSGVRKAVVTLKKGEKIDFV